MSDSRIRVWFALFVLAVFCLGGAGGFVLGRLLPPPPGRPALFGGRGPGRGGPPGFARGPGGPPPLPPDVLNRLTTELQLDPAQRDQVKTILDERRGRLDAVHREAREQFDKEQRDLRAAIRAVLKPEQQTRFDKFLDRRP